MSASSLVLPAWSEVTDTRRAHIERVTALLDEWADALRLSREEAAAWHDAGVWHDALRDADEPTLRHWADDWERPVGMLHGPAAARRLALEGEMRAEVLEAIRWHTSGNPEWGRTGRALFMADFLEPGRNFMRADRAFLASHLPTDFDGVFRQVVRMRLEWTLREGKSVYPETVALWNRVR